MITLSVCIISKNEEKNIARCLSSVREIADEIIVVDTGSTDSTIQIAKMFGSKVINHEFNNDFATSRNVSIENATMDYILYLDCDEELDYKDSKKIKSIIEENKNSGYEGYTLNLINVTNDQIGMKTPSLRLFKNRPQYRFKGRIHEIIQPSIVELKGEDCFFITDLKFYHYGYDENLENIKRKSKRNLDILNSYCEEEKNGFYYYNLANEYLRIKDNNKALDCYEKCMEYPDDNGFKIYVPIYKLNVLIEENKFGVAIKEGLEFLKLYPTYKDLYFIVGVCYSKLGMYKEFIDCLINYKRFSMDDYGFPDYNFHLINDIDGLIEDAKKKL